MRTPPEPHFQQSAVIPYRWRGGHLEVLIITSSRHRRWVVPKGLVEPGMSPRASALKEAFEEAGIEGEVVGGRLGTYTYEKWGGTCIVRVFAMAVSRVHKRWEEEHRDRVWLRPRKAASRLEETRLQRMVREIRDAVPRSRAK